MLYSKLTKGLSALLCAVACFISTQGAAQDYCGPCGPCAPCAPCAPCIPCAPCAPCAPCGPYYGGYDCCEDACDSCCAIFCNLDVGLGIFYDQKSRRMLPYLTGLYKYFTVGFGVNGCHVHDKDNDGDGGSLVNYSFHLGLRCCLCPCLYLTGGAGGMYSHISNHHRRAEDDLTGRHNPFVVGPYIGLDYHLSSCVLLTAQIYPYARHRFIRGDFEDQYFQQGMIGISYLF